MKFDENLASIHAYLCGDGYVIKNPLCQKRKYYLIGFRNTNLTLLKDFQKKFMRYFGVCPILRKGERCIIQRKELYYKLVEKFRSFYSREWNMPILNKKLCSIWLRAFFDCEGWIYCKDKQNRHIGLDSINERGLNQIIKNLNRLGIKTIKRPNYKRNIFRIFIYGKDNLIKFREKIGFLHPEKREKLNATIENFVNYIWNFPKNEKELKEFVIKKLKEKIRIKKPNRVRIISKEKINLEKIKNLLKKFYNIDSIIYNSFNGEGIKYFELNINKKEEITKLINLKLIPDILKNVQRKT